VRFLKGAVRATSGSRCVTASPRWGSCSSACRHLRAGRSGPADRARLAIPAGIVSAVRRNTSVDYVSTVVALLGQANATFWLGIMLILIFSCGSTGCLLPDAAASST